MIKTFESKKGLVVYLVYFVCFAFVLGGIIATSLLWGTKDYYAYIIMICIGLFLAGFFTFSVCSTYYVFKEDHIYVVSGLIRFKIKYAKIQDAFLCNNLWSSTALSYERVGVRVGKTFFGVIYLSPKDRQGFVEEVLERAEEHNKA